MKDLCPDCRRVTGRVVYLTGSRQPTCLVCGFKCRRSGSRTFILADEMDRRGAVSFGGRRDVR